MIGRAVVGLGVGGEWAIGVLRPFLLAAYVVFLRLLSLTLCDCRALCRSQFVGGGCLPSHSRSCSLLPSSRPTSRRGFGCSHGLHRGTHGWVALSLDPVQWICRPGLFHPQISQHTQSCLLCHHYHFFGPQEWLCSTVCGSPRGQVRFLTAPPHMET